MIQTEPYPTLHIHASRRKWIRVITIITTSCIHKQTKTPLLEIEKQKYFWAFTIQWHNLQRYHSRLISKNCPSEQEYAVMPISGEEDSNDQNI